MNKFLTAIVLSLLFTPLLVAQSNDYMDQVLDAKVVTPAQVVYMVAVAAAGLPDTTTETEAMAYARQNGWPIPHGGDGPVHIDEYSFLLAKAFGLKGGVMYSLFSGPRYSMRELQHRKVIIGRPDPGKILSGEESLRLLANMVSLGEGK